MGEGAETNQPGPGPPTYTNRVYSRASLCICSADTLYQSSRMFGFLAPSSCDQLCAATSGTLLSCLVVDEPHAVVVGLWDRPAHLNFDHKPKACQPTDKPLNKN